MLVLCQYNSSLNGSINSHIVLLIVGLILLRIFFIMTPDCMDNILGFHTHPGMQTINIIRENQAVVIIVTLNFNHTNILLTSLIVYTTLHSYAEKLITWDLGT